MLVKSLVRLIPVLALIAALPRMAHAYVDPGTGAMIWQLAAAAVIGCLFYVKRVASWLRTHLGLRSQKGLGFAFATCYAMVASPVTVTLFNGHPLPRFNDLFLVGIALTAYVYTWESAAYLLTISLLVSAWVLPPYGSLRLAGFEEWYRMASFTALSVFLICLISKMKTRGAERRAESRSYAMHGAAVGAD